MNAGVRMSNLNVRHVKNSSEVVNDGEPEGCTIYPSNALNMANVVGDCRERRMQFCSSSLTAQPPLPSSVTVSILQSHSQNALLFYRQNSGLSVVTTCQQQPLRTESSPGPIHPCQQNVSQKFPSPTHQQPSKQQQEQEEIEQRTTQQVAFNQQNDSARWKEYRRAQRVADTRFKGPALRQFHHGKDTGYRAQQKHHPVQEPDIEHVNHSHVSNNNPPVGRPQTTHTKASESPFVSTSSSAAAATAKPQQSPCSAAYPSLQAPAVNVGSAGVSGYDCEDDDIIFFEAEPKNVSIKAKPKERAQTKAGSNDDDIIFFEPECKKRNVNFEAVKHTSSPRTCTNRNSQQMPSTNNALKQVMQAKQSDVAVQAVTFAVNEKIASVDSSRAIVQHQDEHNKPGDKNTFGDSIFTKLKVEPLESCSGSGKDKQQEQISGTLDLRVTEIYSLSADSSNHSEVTMSSTRKSFEQLSAEGYFRCGNRNRSCSYLTQLPTQFDAHMRVEHASESAFPCVHCGSVELTCDSLLQHLEEHLKPQCLLLYCVESTCEFNSFSTEDVLQHIVVSHSTLKSFTCWRCCASFSSIHTFVTHVKQNILQIVRCLHCSAKDTDQVRMLAHVSSSHPGSGRMVSIHKILLCQERTLVGWQAQNSQNVCLQQVSEQSSLTSTVGDQPPVPLKETDLVDLTDNISDDDIIDCETPEQMDYISDDEIIIDFNTVGNQMPTDNNTVRCADQNKFPVQWSKGILKLNDNDISMVTAGENNKDTVSDRQGIGPSCRQSVEVMSGNSDKSEDGGKHVKMEKDVIHCVATSSLVENHSNQQESTTVPASIMNEECNPNESLEEENETKKTKKVKVLVARKTSVGSDIRCASDVAHISTQSGNEEKLLKCPYCKKQRKKTQTAIENEIRWHILYKPFSCPHCTEHPFESSSYQRVYRHIQKAHPQICDSEVTVNRNPEKEKHFKHLLQKAINMANGSTGQKSRTNVQRKYKIRKHGSNVKPQKPTEQKPSVPSSNLNNSQVALTSGNFIKDCSHIVSSRDDTIYSYSYTITIDKQMNVFSQQNSTINLESKNKVLTGAGGTSRPQTEKAQESSLRSSGSNKTQIDSSLNNNDRFEVVKYGDENVYSCRLCSYAFIEDISSASLKHNSSMRMRMHILHKHKK